MRKLRILGLTLASISACSVPFIISNQSYQNNTSANLISFAEQGIEVSELEEDILPPFEDSPNVWYESLNSQLSALKEKFTSLKADAEKLVNNYRELNFQDLTTKVANIETLVEKLASMNENSSQEQLLEHKQNLDELASQVARLQVARYSAIAYKDMSGLLPLSQKQELNKYLETNELDGNFVIKLHEKVLSHTRVTLIDHRDGLGTLSTQNLRDFLQYKTLRLKYMNQVSDIAERNLPLLPTDVFVKKTEARVQRDANENEYRIQNENETLENAIRKQKNMLQYIHEMTQDLEALDNFQYYVDNIYPHLNTENKKVMLQYFLHENPHYDESSLRKMLDVLYTQKAQETEVAESQPTVDNSQEPDNNQELERLKRIIKKLESDLVEQSNLLAQERLDVIHYKKSFLNLEEQFSKYHEHYGDVLQNSFNANRYRDILVELSTYFDIDFIRDKQALEHLIDKINYLTSANEVVSNQPQTNVELENFFKEHKVQNLEQLQAKIKQLSAKIQTNTIQPKTVVLQYDYYIWIMFILTLASFVISAFVFLYLLHKGEKKKWIKNI